MGTHQPDHFEVVGKRLSPASITREQESGNLHLREYIPFLPLVHPSLHLSPSKFTELLCVWPVCSTFLLRTHPVVSVAFVSRWLPPGGGTDKQ